MISHLADRPHKPVGLDDAEAVDVGSVVAACSEVTTTMSENNELTIASY